MPTAQPRTISTICDYIKDLKDIKKVLDVGYGWGKWGMLVREYVQIWNKDMTIDTFKNYKEELVVDGIDIADYSTPITKEIYNNLIVGNIVDFVKDMDKYDLVIMGDIIEHLTPPDGYYVLRQLRKKCRYVIITTPNYIEKNYRKIDGKDYEKHLSFWNNKSFPDNPIVKTINQINIVFYEQNNKNN